MKTLHGGFSAFKSSIPELSVGSRSPTLGNDESLSYLAEKFVTHHPFHANDEHEHKPETSFRPRPGTAEDEKDPNNGHKPLTNWITPSGSKTPLPSAAEWN